MLDYIIITIIQIICLVGINETTWGHKHIGILFIIALLLNMIAFKSYCSIPYYKKNQDKNQLMREMYPKPVFPNNTLAMKDKSLFYSENMTSAKFGNGKVYCLAPNNTFHIGNYRIEGDHVYVGANDDREIGNIALTNGSPSLIILSNIGWYKHVGIKYDEKKTFSMIAAEIFYNPDKFDVQIIIDNQSNEVVAMYKGDPIGAAAAFVCMQYECSRYGRCHDFYHSS